MLKKRWLGACALLVLGGAAVANTLWFRPWSFGVFLDRVSIEKALAQPQALSSSRILAPYGLRWYDGKLDDLSDTRRDADFAQARSDLATLQGYDRAQLGPQEQISYDAMLWTLQQQVAGERFRFHDYPVNQLDGQQFGAVAFLTDVHQINDLTDAHHYLDRLRALPAQLSQLQAAQEARAQRGIVAPHFALAKSAVGMRTLVAKQPQDNELYTSFQQRLASSQVPPTNQPALLSDALAILSKQVYPAYRDLIDHTERLAQAHPRNDGAWALPDGAAYYAWQLADHTTTHLTPDQVHQLGLSEVARIEGEIRAILHTVGEPADDVGAALRRLGEDPRFLFPDTDAGREQILDGYRTILAQMQAALPQVVPHLPTAKIDVRRAPAVSEKTAASAYYDYAALDGSRPGVFYTALYDIKATPRWSMRSLAFHEGVPGHHLQTSIAREQTNLPLFRRFAWYDAYGEGWALYAERLGWEMGLEPDPYDQIGRLQAELYRAVRLVVDTGMHAQRWTREQAIDYMESTTGMAHSDVEAEVERYLIWPGQACAYKIGMMRILDLREQAKARLGKRFDLRGFHDVVLRNGALPLDLLTQQVDAWIAAQASATQASAT